MKPFEYLRPTNLPEACAALAEDGINARLLAGGTDLTVGLRHGHLQADRVIDLKKVRDIAPGIGSQDGMLRVTAGMTMTMLADHLAQADIFPALRDAANVVGSIQIRNRATLAGNICNASPAADTVPVLAALDAHVEITGPKAVRRVPVATFIEGNRKIDLKRGEIVSAVLIPLSGANKGCAFDRITRRRGVDLATANLCCVVDGAAVTFAFGSVSLRPLVVHSDDPVLTDGGATPMDRADTLGALCANATPISDVRASAGYRTAMLCVMAERSLARAKAANIGGPAHA